MAKSVGDGETTKHPGPTKATCISLGTHPSGHPGWAVWWLAYVANSPARAFVSRGIAAAGN